MSSRDVGLLLLAAGLAVAVIGGLVALGALGWFGRLPGDIRIEGAGGRFRVYAPLVSMLLVSAVLTIVANLLRRWFG